MAPAAERSAGEFMFAPPSIDHFDIPSGFWQLAFANGALAILAWMLAQALAGRAIGALWLVMAIDLAALAYMWSPSGLQAPITWLLVAHFAAQSLLWAGNRMRHRVHVRRDAVADLSRDRYLIPPHAAGDAPGGVRCGAVERFDGMWVAGRTGRALGLRRR